MNEVVLRESFLPEKLDDLARFVLVGRERMTAVRAALRMLDKLEVAEDVRKMRKDEAQILAEELLDAETRIGQILAAMPKGSGGDHGNQHTGGKRCIGAPFATETKEQAIKKIGFESTQAKRFEMLAENPDLVEQVKQEARESDTLPTRSAVISAVKLKKVEERREDVKLRYEKQEIETGKKHYRVIYADPPWMYGNPSNPINVTTPEDYYTQMATDEICKMPIGDICEEDAVLFLWVTSPHLPEGLEVAKSWGFKYKTTFIWDKIKHNMGHYNSVRHEILLVCTRGACTPDVKKLFDSVVSIERTEHSKKPEYFREIIDTIYTEGSRIELFARESPAGWDVFGNQINS